MSVVAVVVITIAFCSTLRERSDSRSYVVHGDHCTTKRRKKISSIDLCFSVDVSGSSLVYELLRRNDRYLIGCSDLN
ncbi:hypothetical protein MKW98_001207 [Papaver atlanticum]|uniref:Secreted protein n=1 Tax=Papaver atlanticum TaxID=357466 RepID=A0AAD4SSY7_9MAGN|nr:hypothetical protein MKW98_001207 [Papaver atlanticum]